MNAKELVILVELFGEVAYTLAIAVFLVRLSIWDWFPANSEESM
jgi:hypothetical protein